MADNINVTEGSGKVIAADDVSSVFFQKVKLDAGGDGVSTPILAGGGVEASALRVTIASDSTGVVSIDDNGGAITVDGTVAVTNAGITTIAGAVAGTEMQVDVLTMPTVTETNSGAIKTAVEVIDNAISGSEMQVDVVASLPAGTNAIGKLAANSGVDIGDVDVLSLPSLPAGTNNIGDVDVLSLPALAAGTNNIGDVDVVSMASGKTILRAVISAASSGDNTLVAAVADKKIKVLSVCLVATAAVTVRFESGASGTALSGVISLDAKSGFILNAPADPNMHWFETGVNTLLNLELGGAVQVSGMMTYYTEA